MSPHLQTLTNVEKLSGRKKMVAEDPPSATYLPVTPTYPQPATASGTFVGPNERVCN